MSETKTKKMEWYIVRTLSNREKSVSERIQKDPSLDGIIGKVVLPTQNSFYLKDKKKIKREKIMYPGYVFVEASGSGELKYFLRGCDGAIGFLTDRSGNIEPLSEKEANRMLGQQQEMEEAGDQIIPFIVGEEIRIIDGAFSSMIGTIEEISGQKVKVNVMIFDRNTPLEVSILQIEKK